MAKLAYCKLCNATYPLNIVIERGRTLRQDQGPSCPMGHTDVEELDAPRKPRGKK